MTRGFITSLAGLALVLITGAAAYGLTFAAPDGDIGGASSTTAIFMADVDGDGDLDMIEGINDSGAYSSRIWTNVGGGFFSDSGEAIGSPTDTRAGAVFAADLDNDGDLDIAHANQDTQDIRIFKNDGLGAFTDTAQSLGALDSLSIFLADLDSDGDFDMIEGVGPDTANANKVYMNDGAGTFTDSGQSLGGSDTYSVFGADVDADGDIDFMAGNYNSDNTVWMNDGYGIFSDSGQALGGAVETTSIFGADVDADGDIDFIEGSASGTSRIWINNSGIFSESIQTLGINDTRAVFACDMDSDGDIDFAEGNYDENNLVYLNDGYGAFSNSGVSLGASSTVAIFIADANGDNFPDFIAGNAGQGNRFWPNNTSVISNSQPSTPSITGESDAYANTPASSVTLDWAIGSDTDTMDTDLLTYDVRIGTTSGGCDIYCGLFPATGTMPWVGALAGNAGHPNYFSISLPATATYYWSVRTVDPTYYRSAWSSEDSFMITFENTPPAAPGVVFDGPTATDIDFTTVATLLEANWSASTDAESGVVAYWAAIGTSQGATDTQDWTNLSLATSASVSGLALVDGTTYYFSVKAVNNAGMESDEAYSDGQTVDTTAPSTITTVYDGLGADRMYAFSTTSFSASWSASSDAESGISTYWIGIGMSPGSTDALGWTDVGNVTATTVTGLYLANGQVYYFSVMAVNGAGLDSAASFSDGVLIDNTVPSVVSYVNDGSGADEDYSVSTSIFYANWATSTDMESGITSYWVGLGTTPGATDTVPLIDNGTATSTTFTGLTLIDGVTYYTTVFSENGAGGTSSPVNSDGAMVDSTAPSAACSINDGPAADIDFASSTLMIYANWCDFTDAESGVMSYSYAVGSAAGATDTLNWNNIGTATSAIITDATLVDGSTYYITVIAENNAGLISSEYYSDGQTIDLTGPSTPAAVYDGSGTDRVYASSTTFLAANWTAATDSESGILTYLVAAGLTASATDAADWTDVGNVTSTTLTGLSLTDGVTYYISVIAVNGAGISGSSQSSDGQTIESTPPTDIATVNDGTGADVDILSSATDISANWSDSSDPESGLFAYWFAVGTSPGNTDVVNWTDNSTATSATVTGLTLVDGNTYYVSVKAENGAGGTSNITTSDGALLEMSPPTDIATVNDGTGADEDYSTDTTQFSANWSDSTDPESGIAAYWFAIGTTAGASNTLDWTSNSTSTSTTVTGLSLAQGTSYYFSVQAENGVGIKSNVASSDGLTIDTTAPSVPSYINDGVSTDIDFTSTNTGLSANWAASSDSESGIAAYYVAVGTTSGATNVVDWVSNATQTAATLSGLSLSSGITYYVSVKAENNAGLESAVTTSDGVMVDVSGPSAIKTVNDGDRTTDMSGWSKNDSLSANWTESTDTQSGILYYWVAIGTTAGGTDFLTWTNAGTSLSFSHSATYTEGQIYYFSVKSENGAGLQSTPKNSNGITIKTADPTSTVTNPVNGSYVKSVTSIDGTAVDGEDEGLSIVEIILGKDNGTFWNGQEWISKPYWITVENTSAWSYKTVANASTLPVWETDTSYDIVSRASDNIGNVEIPSATTTFTYDTTRPVMTILSPVDGYETNNQSVTVTGTSEYSATVTVTDSAGVVKSATIQAGSGTSTSSFSVTVPLTEGENILEGETTDLAGNTGHDSITVYLDTVAPTAEITSPAYGVTVSSTIDIIGTASDEHMDYYTLEYGPGSSPSAWKLFKTSSFPVTKRALGSLDMSRLSGTYTIRLTVMDSHGNSSTDKVTFTVSNKIEARIQVSSVNWMMSSMPMTPDQNTISKLMDSNNYTLFWWNPDVASDPVYGKYVKPSTLSAGQGLWILPKKSQSETIVLTGSPVNSTTDFEYQLQSGWNQIGTPFNWGFTWAGIKVKSGSEPVSLESAVSAGYIGSTPFYYTGSGWRQVTELTPAKLTPGTGYFIYSYNDSTSLVFDPGADSANGIARIIREEPSLKIKLSAATSLANDMDNIVVLMREAEDTHDGRDLMEPPPAFGKYVSLYFPHKDWGANAGRYTNDYRKPSGFDPGCQVPDGARSCKLLDITLETNDTGSETTITWQSLSNYSDTYTITLTDVSTGNTVDMTAVNSYTFTTASGKTAKRDFKLSIVKKGAPRVTASHTIQSGWNLVTIPLEPEVTDALTLLGDDLNAFTVYQYYDGLFNTESDEDGVDIQAGIGYWIFVPEDTTIDVEGTTTDPDFPISIPVTKGWNLIGNPFDSSLSWSDNITVTCGNSSMSLRNAVSQGIISKRIFTYNGSEYTRVEPGGFLDTWKGYFLYSEKECSLQMKK